MTVDYSETTAPEGDAEGKVLETLADGHPYVFVVCAIQEDGDLNIRLAVGGGVSQMRTVKSILGKALKALPPEDGAETERDAMAVLHDNGVPAQRYADYLYERRQQEARDDRS